MPWSAFRRFVPEVNRFAQGTLSPFLNFHRSYLFATEYRDGNGRIRRKYLASDVMTTYDRLRSLPDAGRFLKPESTSPCSTPSLCQRDSRALRFAAPLLVTRRSPSP